jgi:DNA-binding transcriptional LysR family regulator
MSTQRIEVSLLFCLEALLAEKSVTRAANRLGMSQPGMSNALSRLRELTRDPLLVRTGRGMELTPRALELTTLVKTGLLVLEDIFSDPRPFEPARAEGTLTVAMSDSMALLLGPQLIGRFDREAPQLCVGIQRLDHTNLFAQMAEGRIDLAVGYATSVPEQMYASDLLIQSLSAIRSARHPRIQSHRLTLEDFMRERHVLTAAPNVALSWAESSVAEALKLRNLVRTVGARVNSILLAPEIVVSSSLLCTMPTWLARRSEASLQLKLHDVPVDITPFKTTMVWHERTHRQPLHQWVRAAMRQLVQEVCADCGHRDGLPLLA